MLNLGKVFDNRQQATGNRQQTTDNRQQTTGNRQQATAHLGQSYFIFDNHLGRGVGELIPFQLNNVTNR
ncbi:hypothetical protein D5R40_21610 [Okeania hirsuta]|uniref:Uncharacterized protein n=1 Tax=Okeania hirsuta TaxID=1458930 RepID=A0A3N6P899_9CYAN|nr:hypothetical protein D4Z78_28535 [Okeania hirsuta]RQH21610.1 hypothetical protein D5R40_31455 [Okeania hirsuta]RQH33475.1 hypothetical protein D5R40_21610 [Okeania hirsuta]